MNIEQYIKESDVVLQLIRPVQEAAYDTRNFGVKNRTGAVDKGPNGNLSAYDWRVWNGAGFGKRLLSSLKQGNGYSMEVTDFGQCVMVRASYYKQETGQSVSKTFCITFDNPKAGDGTVFSTSTKWRTISNVDQAASYINSTIQSMTP